MINAGRLCPCGCGNRVGKYNGQENLTCYEFWQTVPREIRRRVMLPGILEEDRRRACFEVIKLALERKKAREA